ncbi:flagellar hook-basal body complex protein [Sporolactobacillus sp. THM19-2]|jgi:flagellar hook protein FlgE|uniref:flagellar hook-basal body complex protein n=1 Tax=Sporolactobacillus sp. THM19-2 TaxID=2511171 RepID=UPI001020B4B7|nr:flagellar hook-basal body complex protein [Sporolactobacillus sp. THM19-2]RYL92955.1 flagellar hook-basal body complex protein [Sporolactobacillus sp. THM19-2]
MLLRSLGSGVSGLKNFQTALDVIGNNISNVSTAGFKKGRVNFQDLFSEQTKGASAIGGNASSVNAVQVGLGSQASSIDNIVTDGTVNPTGNPYDLAIHGEGYFLVQDEDGNSYYTRAGDFKLNVNGELVNSQGMHVRVIQGGQNPNGNIDLTGYTEFSVAADGTVSAVGPGPNGTGDQNTVQNIGRIAIGTFSNPAGLEKVGDSLFRETTASGPANYGTEAQGTIQQGALEGSNVDLTNEMTGLIEAQRAYQANARTITTADQILQELVQLKR